MLLSKDSIFYQTGYLESAGELLKELEKDYDVNVYTFGDQLNILKGGSNGFNVDYNERQTDISSVFREIRSI